ncbi:MAG TPA: phosphatidate cytidylyltransferase [Myxococcota bacterium]|nr:phosphatidate cytidylyltransferase [Myxococcota bacterium]
MSEGATEVVDSRDRTEARRAPAASDEGASRAFAAGPVGATSTPPPPPDPDRDAEEAARRAARRKDLVTRLGTAAVLIPFVFWAIAQGGLVYLAIVVGIGLLAQEEFYGLIVDKGARPIRGVGLGFGVAVMLVAYFGNEYHAMLLMTLTLLVLMVAQVRKNEIQEAMASISGTFFGVFYVPWLLSHAVLLRKFEAAASAHYDPALLVSLGFHSESGIFFMVYTLVTIVGCDAGAYFAGRAWGRKKLAPEISPNKSVEGALGGVIAGVLFGLATKLLFDLYRPDWSAALPWSVAAGFGFVLCLMGIVGDLLESLLKRDAKVKDTGALLPGMGGVLDRIDAPLLGLPTMYYLLLGYVFLRAS